MTDLPQISEQDIVDNSTSKSFQRGADYLQQGAVKSLVRRGNLITAQVLGSYTYDIYIDFQGNDIRSVRCTCPYGYGGWCKHIVATLLSICRSPQAMEERPSLLELLGDLDKKQVIEIIMALIPKEPSLLNKIERIVHKQYKNR
jgi:uncharacterized Zn finger protein